MKRLALRSMLAVAMVTCLLSTTQAGIIPWVYDTIFGPVRYPAYGPAYGPVYSAPTSYYSPSRCSPCAVNYRAASSCSTGRCSTGRCSTLAYYPTWPIGYAVVSSPCSTKCSTKKTDWRATETDRRAPEPRDEGNTTFADEKDPFNANKPPQPAEEETPVKPEKSIAAGEEGTGESEVPIKERAGKDWKETSKKKPVEEAEKTPGETGGEIGKPAEGTGGESTPGAEEVGKPEEKPAETGAESASPGDASTDVLPPIVKEKPGETPAAEGKKSPPLGDEDKTNFGKNVREGESTETPAESEEGETGEASKADESGESKPLEAKPLPKVQDKSSWKFSRPARRIAFRASFGNVRISRVARSVKADYVIPAASLTRIAER
ncbi:MAG: hypothetical protein H8E37_12385 [Planctomycetes bacterium]|nr:hypothetical protein [Planctomycetota bacterium]